MQILHIVTEKTWRGGENQLRLLLEGLATRGIRCHVACPPDSEAATRLTGLAEIVSVRMSGIWKLASLPRLVTYCKENGIQIVDAQTSHAHTMAIQIKRFVPSIGLVVHRRVDFPPGNNFFSRSKYLSPRVNRYVAISRAIGQILTEYGISADRVETIPSAVDSEVYKTIDRAESRRKWLEPFDISLDATIIGNASALTSQKGYPNLIRSLAILKDRGHEFHCLIAGDGHLRDELTKMVQESNLQDRVHFLGWIKEVPSFLASLDIFAMPSTWEGLGTAIQDATYAGCPVVATRVGGIPEMIEDHESGLLSEVGNSSGLADNLSLLLSQPELRKAFNENAKKRISENFSLDNMVEKNLAVYQQILDEANSANENLG